MNRYILCDMSNTLIYTNVDNLVTYIDNASYTSASFSSYDVIFISPNMYVSHIMYSMSDEYIFEISSDVESIPPYTAYYMDDESTIYSESSFSTNNIIDDMSGVYYGMRNV